jgi:hypothetical protein
MSRLKLDQLTEIPQGSSVNSCLFLAELDEASYKITGQHLGNLFGTLPAVTSADQGKMLIVDASGNWVAVDVNGTNISY